MTLYVNGQDIGRLVLGLIQDGAWLVGPRTLSVPPEEYLLALDGFLLENGHARAEGIMEIALVVGPGSATALRSSVSMVNAIAFAKNVAILAVEKAPESDDAEVLPSVSAAQPVSIARPVYLHGARITASSKDALLRKKEV